MKKFLFLALAFMLVSSATIAATNSQNFNKDKGYISTSATVSREVVPTVAEVKFSVETTDKLSTKASEQNKQKMSKLITELNKLINKQAGEYVKTLSYNLHPQYIYSKDNVKKLSGYVVVNTISVKVKDVNKLSKLIDTAVANGATSVCNISFSIENIQGIKDEMARDAVLKSAASAKNLATALGLRIDSVKSISLIDNSYNEAVYQNSNSNYLLKGMDTALSAPIEVQKIKLNVGVNSNFYVK